MKVKIVDSKKQLYAVKEEWIAFEEKVDNRNITSSYMWQVTWWEHFGHIDNSEYGRNKQLCVIFLYADTGELCAIAPFCLVRRTIKKVISYIAVEFIGQQWAATYLDIVSNKLSEQQLEYIMSWLRRNEKYDVIHLRYIPEYSCCFNLNSPGAYVLSACPEIKSLDINSIVQGYSKKLKQNLRTAHNKINRSEIEFNSEIKEKFNTDLFNSIVIVSKSKLSDGKHSIYLDNQKKEYLKNIYSIMNFNCVNITFNGSTVAYRVNIIYNERKYCIDASYDRSFKKYDLGAISVQSNIEDSCNKKLSNHCFGTGIDSYKLKFTNDICRLFIILIRGNTLKSKIIMKYLSRNSTIQENEFEKKYDETIR